MENKLKRCPYCAEDILAAAIKCKHCGSMLDSEPLAKIVVPDGLFDSIPTSLERKLTELLDSEEPVFVQLKGVFREALICTDRRVLILKTGAMTGHWFGTSVFQSSYNRITSAQVNTHLLTGYFEVSAGGLQSVRTSYWARGNDSPQKRENCVSLGRSLFTKFQQAAGFILSNAARPVVSPNPTIF